jgi:hypothetical protein
MDKWKAALEWYKQLMTVDGAAGVAIAAFLSFAGHGTNAVGVLTVIVAYLAIFVFLISVGLAVHAMFRLINDVDPEQVDQFLSTSHFKINYLFMETDDANRVRGRAGKDVFQLISIPQDSFIV